MTKNDSILACVNFLPAVKVAVVGQCDDELFFLLHEKLEAVGGELVAYMFGDEPQPLPSLKVTMIDNYDKGFRALAREYTTLILNEHYSRVENKERLLKASFKSILNAGDMIIIEDDISGIDEILLENGFVAINEIETDDTIHLLSAKKMHGWGHGL